VAEIRDDEFYIGYVDRAPEGIGRRTRKGVLLILGVGAILALTLLTAQARFSTSVFEFGVVRGFAGVVLERPYPMLLVERDGKLRGDRAFSQYPLVAYGKHGAQDLVQGLDGRPVTLSGSLIYRGGTTMVEVQAESIQPVEREAEIDRLAMLPLPPEIPLGEFTLIGEIVDSKCYMGVMKPGEGKPHRGCAARCISGGSPPILLVLDPEGRRSQFLLVGADGRRLHDELLDMVAEPVEIRGQVTRVGELLVLAADPSTYRRLGD
jgi:hypothetical protein